MLVENCIRLANREDLECIVELLNETALKLKDKGINQWDYPWDPQEIIPDIISERVYILASNERIIGTFSIKDIEGEYFQQAKPGDAYIYRIAVSPQEQGRSIGNEIMNYAFDHVWEKSKVLYLDCWSGNEKLRVFYSRSGMEYLGDYLEEDYYVSVFKYEPKDSHGWC